MYSTHKKLTKHAPGMEQWTENFMHPRNAVATGGVLYAMHFLLSLLCIHHGTILTSGSGTPP
jgi:hypothetical protein